MYRFGGAPTFAHWLVACWASQTALVVKNLPANAGEIRDVGSIPGLRRSPGEENGNPLQHSCLENPMDRGAWQATVLGLQRVRHDWSNLARIHTLTLKSVQSVSHWRTSSWHGAGVCRAKCQKESEEIEEVVLLSFLPLRVRYISYKQGGKSARTILHVVLEIPNKGVSGTFHTIFCSWIQFALSFSPLWVQVKPDFANS